MYDRKNNLTAFTAVRGDNAARQCVIFHNFYTHAHTHVRYTHANAQRWFSRDKSTRGWTNDCTQTTRPPRVFREGLAPAPHDRRRASLTAATDPVRQAPVRSDADDPPAVIAFWSDRTSYAYAPVGCRPLTGARRLRSCTPIRCDATYCRIVFRCGSLSRCFPRHDDDIVVSCTHVLLLRNHAVPRRTAIVRVENYLISINAHVMFQRELGIPLNLVWCSN